MSERLPDGEKRDDSFMAVMEAAAHLQRLVPGAVLVGGAAAILYADHRESSDHDHVLDDLAERFEIVLEAIEKDEGWATNPRNPRQSDPRQPRRSSSGSSPTPGPPNPR